MTSNGNVYAALTPAKLFAGATSPSPWRIVSGFSEVQSSRLKLALPLPSVLKNHFELVNGPPSSAVGNPGLKNYLYLRLYSREGILNFRKIMYT